MTAKMAEDRMMYSKRYASILTHPGEASELVSLAPNKRIHVMKAISSLAKFTGMQDDWLAIRKRYGLQWSTGREKIEAFNRFFDNTRSLDTMLHWLREAIEALPVPYSRLLLFCTLTGLRGSEAVESVRLLNRVDRRDYYNPEQQILQHYRFPDLFIRRTKAVYISVVNDEIIGIAKKIDKTPQSDRSKKAIMRRHLSMRLKYCRKIYASYLHRCGVSSDLIDILQGRIGKNILLRHYLMPSNNYKDQVLQALSQLMNHVPN